jgi:histidinol-phosphate aminotransferase
VTDPRRSLVDAVVRPEVRALSAYHVPPVPPGAIKLDAMENPYSWPQDMVEAWLARLRAVSVNRYPDPRCESLKVRLREALELPAGAELMLGNGSDELIALLVQAAAGPGRTVLGVEPSFAMYRIVAGVTGSRFETVPLDPDDFSLGLDATLRAIERVAPSLVLLAYPNNPTGNLFEEQALEQIIEYAPGVVVIDEAYAPFADATFVDRVLERPNLLVMRTVSKLGLAGLRLGYLVGAGTWIEQLDKLRLPYNVNVLTQVSAEFALEHYAVLEAQTAAIRVERERLFAALDARADVHAWPSSANFVLARVPRGEAGRVCAGLLERGVLVRSFDGASALLADCIRVSVGTPAENDTFLAALDAVLR